MLKFALLAGAMTIAAPVLAQTSPSTMQSASSGSMANDPSMTTGPQSAPMQSAPTQSAPTQSADPATAAPADQSAATTQPATGDQVAQIVDKEFPTYDKSGKGSLTKTEFGNWMVALKSAGDPTAKADTKENKAWVEAAFAQADTDKNKSVSKAELTGFLTKAQS